MSARDRNRIHRRSRSISSRRSLRRSRSRSPERRFSRRRSRSASRNRRRPNVRARSRSRSPASKRKHRKKSSSSSSNSSDEVVEIIPPIRSDDPKYVNSRLFVGKLPRDFTSTELTDYFKRYGQITDAVAHSKGYGFVQFSKREDALTAVENESGSVIKGVKVDIRMAAEGGRYANSSGAYRGRELDRREGRGTSVPGRERSPARRSPARRSPVRDRAEPYPPYRDPLPPRDDPYYADPYRRPPDRFDDPYRRRDPYDDPYARDPYYPPPPRRAPPPGPPVPSPTIECEIIMLHPQLRGYADKIHDKLKAIKLVCGILSVPADQPIQKQIEDMTRHGVLYALVINSQNEVHASVILNILHGTPQEHRNMPLDDAVALISKTFEAYLKERSEKLRATVALPPTAVAAPFIPPTSDISYLLNLLADNRQLTVTELEKVMVYIKSRRDKMLEAEGRQPPNENAMMKPKPSPAEQEQEELKTKILSILNGGGTAPANVPTSYGDRVVKLEHPSPVVQQRPNPSMINFDSPSVQQALDNLIQSGPNLLKNISPGVAQSQASNNGRLTTANPSSPGYGGRPAAQPTGYGAAPGGYAARPESEAGYGNHHTGSAQMYGATGHGAAQPPGMRRY